MDGADAGRARGPEPRARGSRRSTRTRSGWWARIALAIALASASQDVAYDAYAVDVLREDEQGPASGARLAFYRAAMLVSGGVSITLAGRWGWAAVNALLGIVYVAMLFLTWLAPEPEERTEAPRTLRDAVWEPFLGFLARHRALEILAFVFLYKFADQLAQALTRPFLIDMGYDSGQRGVALSTIGMVATILGGLIGGVMTTLAGLGHSLWIFGLLQIFSNVGYFFLAACLHPRFRSCTAPPDSSYSRRDWGRERSRSFSCA